MDRAGIDRWVESYVRAWNSNDPSDIEALFTDDAEYVTGPFDEPWRGRGTIVDSWLESKDEPGNTTFTYDILAVDGETAVIEGRTGYEAEDETFANIWVVRLVDDGRCNYFLEYWIQQPKDESR